VLGAPLATVLVLSLPTADSPATRWAVLEATLQMVPPRADRQCTRQPRSHAPNGEVLLDEVRVPRDRILASVTIATSSRRVILAGAEIAVQPARPSRAASTPVPGPFGRPIGQFQGIKHAG